MSAFLRTFALAALPVAILSSNVALATDKNECVAAYEQAQILRDRGKLRGAREQLLVCMQPSCPAFIRSDCTQWLANVDLNTPTVVISARDQNGREITAVRVTADGTSFLERLDGKAMPLDPGPHTFRFEQVADAPVEQKYVIHQGERNRPIAVQLGGHKQELAAAGDPPKHAPWGWIAGAGAIGVAGIGTFAYLGLGGRADVDRLRTQCAPSCAQSDVDAAQRKLLAADVSLGVGVVSLGIAAWLLLSNSSKPTHPSVALDLFPLPQGGMTEVAVRFE